MAPNDIAQKVRRQPFQPFRVHVSDGSSYDVADPMHAYIAQTEMAIGLAPDDNGIPARSVYIDTRHVTRIEPLPGSTAPPSGGGRR